MPQASRSALPHNVEAWVANARSAKGGRRGLRPWLLRLLHYVRNDVINNKTLDKSQAENTEGLPPNARVAFAHAATLVRRAETGALRDLAEAGACRDEPADDDIFF